MPLQDAGFHGQFTLQNQQYLNISLCISMAGIANVVYVISENPCQSPCQVHVGFVPCLQSLVSNSALTDATAGMLNVHVFPGLVLFFVMLHFVLL